MSNPANSTPAAPPSGVSDCQWIVFDAVGTLIDPRPSVAVAYHAVGSRYGSRLDVLEVGRRFRSAFRRSEQDGFPGGPTERWVTSDAIEEARWRWIVGDVFPDITDPEGCFQELWDHFAQPSSWCCFADIGDSLNQLVASGYRLAIASNFDRRLHSVCAAIPQLSGIELRIVSATVGVRKPARRFYSAVAQACGSEPQQILMIGDNPEHDVVAPRAAGFRALHLDRGAGDVAADRVRSLQEIVTRMGAR
ncbi:MAG: HAD-IA family hydrolase [Planctomycetes bacterium]|nr:HAD-IA family hydrolase [Planctomycetota bacterium]